MMYERMLDKQHKPDWDEVKDYLGTDAYARLLTFQEELAKEYDLAWEVRFPFGNNYGWGIKLSHRSMHLCYAFFERGAFTVMIQIGDRQVLTLEENMNFLSQKAKDLWNHRYPCGENGGWVRLRILEDHDLQDAYQFVHFKKKPILKK